MRLSGAVAVLMLCVACGASTPAAGKASPTPAPTPTPIESGAIEGAWKVTVTTTVAYGAVDNKVGETYDRTWAVTKGCAVGTCAATVQAVTATGPATLKFTYDGGIYTAPLEASAPCPNPNTQGGAWAITGTYKLTVTAASAGSSAFRATAFSGSFVEDLTPNAVAAAQRCNVGHIEQRLVGTRTD
jgi:hypothetical protein